MYIYIYIYTYIHTYSPRIYGGCFGHQIVAHALGGMVDYNPNERFILKAETINIKYDFEDCLLKVYDIPQSYNFSRYLYIHIYIYIHIYSYLLICRHLYVLTNMYVNMYINIYVYIYIYIYIYININDFPFVYIYTYTWM
jgi:hypothetical protein